MNRSHSLSNALHSTGAIYVAYVSCGVIAFLVLGSIGAASSVLFLPLFVAALFKRKQAPQLDNQPKDQRDLALGTLSKFLGEPDHPTIALVVEMDDFEPLEEVYGRDTLRSVLTLLQSAIEENLTAHDVTVHLEGARFMAALAPQGPSNTEGMLNICTRIQHALPHISRATKLPAQLTASIGFASSNIFPRPTAEKLAHAAIAALTEAKRHAPNAVRAYSQTISNRRALHQKIAKDAVMAFEHGEIFAHFQPQIDVETGQLSGFEALARWHHPENGIMAPAEFLPSLERAGLMPTLGETMVKQALQALTFWDKAGLQVPRVGINFSTNELRNPRLVDSIATHLDVGNIPAERLNIEVLETVIASDANDDITNNLAALADLGCGIDLDDFGTGYASIANIRTFSVKRIKIDRSFINGIDTDDEQRKMVAAILTMADRLGVKALADGVETRTERDTVQSLGCHDIQGFQIARPMPIQETIEWANAYFAQTPQPVQLTRRAS